MNYKTLTIHEKINFKDYLKGYCLKDSKNGRFFLKQDMNDHAIKYAKNGYSNNIRISGNFAKTKIYKIDLHNQNIFWRI